MKRPVFSRLGTFTLAILAAVAIASPSLAMIIGAGEIRTKAGVVSERDLGASRDLIASMTTTTTPATGSCAVQFVFKNAEGRTITGIRSFEGWISSSVGAPVTAVTSFAALTNGSVDVKVTGKIYNVLTTAAGLLGLTVTGTAATRYITFRLANGRLLTSSAIVIN